MNITAETRLEREREEGKLLRRTFCGSGENGAWKLGMWLGSLGSQDNVGSVFGTSKCDRFADATRAAAHKNCLSGQMLYHFDV